MVINADVPVSANPHSWLVLLGHPAESTGPRCMTGTLRPTYRERVNTAASFAAAKLLIATGEEAAPWRPGAYRHEVVLPREADDRYADPQLLFADIDAAHVATGKALLGYVTLTWTPERLHHQWRVAHALAAQLVDTFDVPVMLVQHCPGLVASSAVPHCHLLLGCRTLTGIGWGGYVAALNGDRLWPLVRERFDALLASL